MNRGWRAATVVAATLTACVALTGVVWPNTETDLSLRLPLLEMSTA